MNLTVTYTRLSRAFEAEGQRVGVRPGVMRVLLAVHEYAGDGDVLGADLEGPLGLTGNSSHSMRRALRCAYDRGLAVGVSEHGKGRSRGVRTRVSLTDEGREAALAVERSALVEVAA